MGMVIVLTGLIAALVVGVIGAIGGARLAKDSGWKFLAILLGLIIGAVLGFAAGAGVMWLIVSQNIR